MNPQQQLLAVINVAGGIAVLGSYAYCLAAHPESRDGLWGGVPLAARPFYTASMLSAAVGYFPFTAYLLFGIDSEQVRVGERFGFGLFPLIYLLILVPSALWMPLTFRVMESWSPLLWIAVRAVLALVAVGSLALLIALVLLQPTGPLWLHALAISGAVAFCIQTVALDALVWPAFFPKI